MMQYPISDGRFMDMALFGVMNKKAFIRSMFIRGILEFPVEFENTFLKFPLKPHYIELIPFIALEGVPRRE